MLATPVEIAVVEQEARYAEHARRFGLSLNIEQLSATIGSHEGREPGADGAALLKDGGEHGHILDVEFAPPEALEPAAIVSLAGCPARHIGPNTMVAELDVFVRHFRLGPFAHAAGLRSMADGDLPKFGNPSSGASLYARHHSLNAVRRSLKSLNSRSQT